MSINGVVVIDKPKGITSFDVVYKMRRLVKTKKIGHTGTLDPDATGVLPICIGNATRAADIMDSTDNKRYTALLRLGSATDTQDATGKVIREGDISSVGEAELKAALKKFTGEIKQIPPMYSAVKVEGKKLYELARKGIEAERRARDICIYSINLLRFNGIEVELDIKCSKGTYIRTLCHDIGEYLGCFGHMAELRRTESGIFKICDAVSLDDLNEEILQKFVIPTEKLFSYPAFVISQKQEYLVRNGVATYCDGEEGMYRVYSQSGEFLCISKIEMIDGKKCLKLVKSFYGGNNEAGI